MNYLTITRSFLVFLILSVNYSALRAQGYDDVFSKQSSLDLEYIPKAIRSTIKLGKGYDMTDPWYPIVADHSPFEQSDESYKESMKEIFPKTLFTPKLGEISGKSFNNSLKEYTMRFEEEVSERTLAQFFHADLKVSGGPFWNLEVSTEYVKNTYSSSKAIKFIIENTTSFPGNNSIKTDWLLAPYTETSILDEKNKWRYFKQKYGSHYVSSITSGYRIEIIALASSSSEEMKNTLKGAFRAWIANGKLEAATQVAIKNSASNVYIKIFCGELKNTETGSKLPFVVTGIEGALKFLELLRDGKVDIDPAPISISLKSYFASVCGEYPKTCKLWDENKLTVLDSNAIPRGTILSWRPPSQNIVTISGETIIMPPPGGWAVCDKRTNSLLPKVPDLSESFLMGVDGPGQLSTRTMGENKRTIETETIGTALGNDQYKSNSGEETTKSPGLNHRHAVRFQEIDFRPKYYTVVFIIKL